MVVGVGSWRVAERRDPNRVCVLGTGEAAAPMEEVGRGGACGAGVTSRIHIWGHERAEGSPRGQWCGASGGVVVLGAGRGWGQGQGGERGRRRGGASSAM